MTLNPIPHGTPPECNRYVSCANYHMSAIYTLFPSAQIIEPEAN